MSKATVTTTDAPARGKATPASPIRIGAAPAGPSPSEIRRAKERADHAAKGHEAMAARHRAVVESGQDDDVDHATLLRMAAEHDKVAAKLRGVELPAEEPAGPAAS